MLNGFLLEKRIKDYKNVQQESKEESKRKQQRRKERRDMSENYRVRVEQFISAVNIYLMYR